MSFCFQRSFLILVCGTAVLIAGIQAAEAPEKSNVDALVRQLGDESFQVREKSEKELKEIGEPVAQVLRTFSDHTDPEIRHRVQRILDYVASLQKELKWIDPKLEGKEEYFSKTMGQAVKLTFRNLSKKPIRIFWIDTAGERKTWRALMKPGATAVCDQSYKTHVWLITDADEKALGLYKIDIEDPVIAVRDEDGGK
jgi:hypothetical protein